MNFPLILLCRLFPFGHDPYFPLEEPQPDEDQNDEAEPRKRPVLLEQQLPVDTHGSSAVLFAIVAQATANLTHAFQAVPAVEQILDILRHDLGDVAQLVVELVEVLGGAGVGVDGLGLADEAVKVHEGVGPEGRGVDLGIGVGRVELAGEIGEIGEGELARVGAVADAEEDDVLVDEVVQGVLGAAVDGGLGFGVAGELAEDLADLALDFGEGGFGLYEEIGQRNCNEEGDAVEVQ